MFLFQNLALLIQNGHLHFGHQDASLFALDDVLDQSRLAYFLRSLPHNTLGRPSKLVRAFGGKVRFGEAMRELQDLLYQD